MQRYLKHPPHVRAWATVGAMCGSKDSVFLAFYTCNHAQQCATVILQTETLPLGSGKCSHQSPGLWNTGQSVKGELES